MPPLHPGIPPIIGVCDIWPFKAIAVGVVGVEDSSKAEQNGSRGDDDLDHGVAPIGFFERFAAGTVADLPLPHIVSITVSVTYLVGDTAYVGLRKDAGGSLLRAMPKKIALFTS
jgi:hypothetical protein